MTVASMLGTRMAGVSFDVFSFEAPSLTSLAPSNGATSGHTLLSVWGLEFSAHDPTSSLALGPLMCTTVSWTSSTQACAELAHTRLDSSSGWVSSDSSLACTLTYSGAAGGVPEQWRGWHSTEHCEHDWVDSRHTAAWVHLRCADPVFRKDVWSDACGEWAGFWWCDRDDWRVRARCAGLDGICSIERHGMFDDIMELCIIGAVFSSC